MMRKQRTVRLTKARIRRRIRRSRVPKKCPITKSKRSRRNLGQGQGRMKSTMRRTTMKRKNMMKKVRRIRILLKISLLSQLIRRNN